MSTFRAGNGYRQSNNQRTDWEARAAFDAERWAPRAKAIRDMTPWLTPYDADLSHIWQASYFRKLGDKTQSIPGLIYSDRRTRQTHSIEVGDIGKMIAKGLGRNPDIVQAAGLLHDIGQPPFAHIGDVPLHEYGRRHGLSFEGNPQTFRVITLLEPFDELGPDGEPIGLNLTRGVLKASLKYPYPLGQGPKPHKGGVYAEEERDLAYFHWVLGGVLPEQPCLDAQIMDKADEIAYVRHDTADDFRSGLMNPHRIFMDDELVEEIARTASRSYSGGDAAFVSATARGFARENEELLRAFRGVNTVDAAKMHASKEAIRALTNILKWRFVASFVETTRKENTAAELADPDRARLVGGEDAEALIAYLAAAHKHHVIDSERTRKHQLEQQEVLAALLEGHTRDPRTLHPEFRARYESAEDTQKPRIIMDSVASLTDSAAYATYRTMYGEKARVVISSPVVSGKLHHPAQSAQLTHKTRGIALN